MKPAEVLVLGDLIADIGMRLEQFPVKAKDIHRLSYMELGPGGACNAAIMAARFGLAVGALGEVGGDSFGLIVREGLEREGVDTSYLQVTASAASPVAGVVVDKSGEPAYLGFEGSLQVRHWLPEWEAPLAKAGLLYADGWAEYSETPAILLQGFRQAREAGVRVVFDPGPGNPDVDDAWVQEAIAFTDVLLVNRAEGRRLAGELPDNELVAALQAKGPAWVVLKRGPEGLMLAHGEHRAGRTGFQVEARDTTGAGDSVSGAILYGLLRDIPIEKLAVLANATGAAKVQKLGTGHNLPSLAEIAAVLQANNYSPEDYLPRNA